MAGFAIQADDRRIILALLPSRTYQDNLLHMMREIQKRDLRIIFICVNQPASFLMDFYGRNGISIHRIFFVDAITQYATGQVIPCPENCRFVSKPNDLTTIGIGITSALKKFEQEKTVIVMDSVNALLIHTSSADVTKFVHFIVSKLRILNIAGVLLAVEKGLDPILLTQMTTFANELYEFSEEKKE